ncbi:MAG TPA: copper amine oxidase N-terminal domain-containing protein [Tissierellaceae bacterium]
MKKACRCLGFILLFIMFFSIPIKAEDDRINVIIDGIPLDIIAISKDNRIYVPVNSISDCLNLDMNFNSNDMTVNLRHDNTNIELTLNSKRVKLNGNELELDVEPFIDGKEIFVPIRFLAESLGKKVQWDAKNHNVIIGVFSKEAKIEDTFLYFNEKYGYTLSFPNSWKDEAIIETRDGILYVYDKKSAERFIEDGYESFGPVFEIRCSDYSVVAELPYKGNYVLYYNDGKYIEALFDRDFQFYPETLDSYTKIFNEGQQVLGSFRKIDNDYTFVEDDRNNYKREIEILNDILDNHTPENIFNKNEIFTYKIPVSNTSFLFLRNMKDEDEISIKIEAEFDSNGKLIRYQLKNYWYELKENQLSQSEALKLANDFVKRYVGKEIEVMKVPDLYPSLYEEDKHETYSDKDGNYIVVVDLVHGFVEYFRLVDS